MLKKCILTSIFTFILCISLSLTTFAATPQTTETIRISEENLSDEQIKYYEEIMFGDDLQVGEIQILSQTEDEVFYVILTNEETEKNTRASGQTTSREFTFYREILGISTKLFSVTLVCEWIEGLKIMNLTGTYTEHAIDVECSWNDNYKQATDEFHLLGLDYSYLATNSILFFSASLAVDKASVSLNCSSEFD